MMENKYSIGKFQLEIPENFALPEYQEKFRLYDRFLPVLVKQLPQNTLIVDVGANIGDTLYSIIQCCDNQIICIEASEFFFELLKKNVNNLPSEFNSRVDFFNDFIGSGIFSGVLEHSSAGTARVIDGTNNIDFKKLDEIILKNYNNKSVSLIKVDTDGFDFDVIKSSDETLRSNEPILFWENYIETIQNVKDYNDLYIYLDSIGYKYFCVFDNYGNIILQDADLDALFDLNNYLFSMSKNYGHRTIYYTDVVSSTDKYETILKESISRFKSIYFK
jgi:FkbM family methyltransferase